MATRGRGGRSSSGARRPAPARTTYANGLAFYQSQVASARRATPSTPPSRLETLPEPLFHHMLSFVVSDVRPTPEMPTEIAQLDLQSISTLSKGWYAHTSELSAQLKLGRAIVHIKKGTRQEMLDVRYRFTLRRPFLRELRLVVTPPLVYVKAQTSAWLQRVTQFLASCVTQYMARLELLDLRNYCGASEDVATIVRTAAKHCIELQSLILPPDLADTEPRRPDGSTVKSLDIQPMHDAVLESLQHWHHHGSNGGLRQLRLATRPRTNRHANSVEFLNRVAMHCPQIELLDGFVFLNGANQCRDEYIVDRATWDHFCSVCRYLRVFNWAMAPYATEFFEIFGRYRKPKLTELTITAARPWDWDKYFAEVGGEEAAEIRASGIGSTAKQIHKVLRGCPALKRLTLSLLAQAVNGATRANPLGLLGAQLGLLGGTDSLAEATKNSMDDEQFGDDFMDALVTHCPNVEMITLVYDDLIRDTFASSSNQIMTFTDRSLRKLANLRFLKSLDTRVVNVSGKGIFDLANSPVNEARGQIEYIIDVGDNQGPCQMAFYRALEGFMRSLQQHQGELHFAKKKFVLCVMNHKESDETRRWTETHFARLEKVMKELRPKYPTLRFRIDVQGLGRSSFKRIASFGVYTVTADPMDEYGWTDIPMGALVDNVFIKSELNTPPQAFSGGYSPFDDYGYGGFEGGGEREGYYGDYKNERGFYGMGGYHFFNGLQLDDSYGPGGEYGGEYGDY